MSRQQTAGLLLHHRWHGTLSSADVPRLRLDRCAGVRHFAHIAHHQRHPLVELELVDGLVVGHVHKWLSVDLENLIADLWGREQEEVKPCDYVCRLNGSTLSRLIRHDLPRCPYRPPSHRFLIRTRFLRESSVLGIDLVQSRALRAALCQCGKRKSLVVQSRRVKSSVEGKVRHFLTLPGRSTHPLTE